MPRLIWAFAGRTVILLILSCGGSFTFLKIIVLHVKTFPGILGQMSRDMTKPTKWLCTQRRLNSAWGSAQSDQSSLCAQWVAKDPSFLNADSEDSDQTGRRPRLIWVFAVRTPILLVLSCRSSNQCSYCMGCSPVSLDHWQHSAKPRDNKNSNLFCPHLT